MSTNIFHFVILLMATLVLTSLCVDMPAIDCEQKTLVRSLCPNVSDSMLQSGIEFGVIAYSYRLAPATPMELTSTQTLLLTLINCLITGDVTTCHVLAECSHRIQQLRSRHHRLWLKEDFRFQDKDIEIAMAQLKKQVATGALKLPFHVVTTLSSLAEVYGIPLQWKESRDELEIELERSILENSTHEISSIATKTRNANEKTPIGRSVPLNDKDKYGNTGLHGAAQQGNVGVLKELLDSEVNLTAKNIDGWTPLMEASNRGNLNIVQLLISRGAPLNDKDKNGNTALHKAAQKG
ncbi:ankyrin-2, partial [Halyomorpha halys]|uniref:ankyrin-2 n=1 Tax=Halyomorpha halys TaxID=286706 RepID=UPI0034D391A9